MRSFLTLLVSLALTLTASPVVAQDAAEQDFSAQMPHVPPKNPTDALASFQTIPGYQIQLVAAEPLVYDPIAMAFDEFGDMFVIEMRGYSEDRDLNIGQIRFLQDTNNDGAIDKATVFADNLAWPTAITCYDGGVFAIVPPNLIYLKDTTGDGRADLRRVIYTGFLTDNVQGMANSLQWGLDNRIHGAGGRKTSTLTRPDQPNTKPVVLKGQDFSFDPRTLDLTPISGGAQHGMSFDDWGRKFVCSNSVHLQMIMYEDHQLGPNPLTYAPSPRLAIAEDGPQAPVFRISPIEAWRIIRTKLRVSGASKGLLEGGGKPAGFFTSATGATIYRGDAFPSFMFNTPIIGDVGSNIIHRKSLTPNGVALTSNRIDPAREFVASTDTWFRPVQFANAPDGSLYAADMYRQTIEHPNSFPPSVKINLDLTAGRDHGRIYRIAPSNFKPRPIPRMGDATTTELVALLDHPNAWHRDTASRLIFQRQDTTAIKSLRALLRNSKLPQARLHALAGLQALNVLQTPDILAALNHNHPRVREFALRYLTPNDAANNPAIASRLIQLAKDTDTRVRFNTALISTDTSTLATILLKNPEDTWIKLAVFSNLSKQSTPTFTQQLATDATFVNNPDAWPVFETLGRHLAKRNQITDAASTLAQLDKQHKSAAAAFLRGLDLGLSKANKPLASHLTKSNQPQAAQTLNNYIKRALATAADFKAPLNDRVQAIDMLSLASFDQSQPALTDCLTSRQPKDVQLAALATLDRYTPSSKSPIPAIILDAWPSLPPAARPTALAFLLNHPTRAHALLDRIEDKSFPTSDLQAYHIDRLIRSSSTRERARQLVLVDTETPRLQIAEHYNQAITKLTGDKQRGRALFTTNCTACHKLENVGLELAPNLAAFAARGQNAIITNLFDPNREVDPAYTTYLLETNDGRTLAGMVTAETPTSIILTRADGHTDTLPRTQIKSLQSTGRSLMPEGLEAALDEQAAADLVAYIMSFIN